MNQNLHRLVFLISFALASPSGAEPIVLDGGQSDASLDRIEQRAIGGAGPSTHNVLVWSRPPVRGSRYALSGRVRYEGVAGRGYLEMWSHFGAEGSFFSRTMADSGLLAALEGDSPGRYFTLPFDTSDSGLLPERIEVNIVLPGAGTVTVSDLRWSSGDAAQGTSGAWWTHADAARLGAVLGVTLGLLGALSGILGGQGRARSVVMGVFGLMATISVGALGAALCGAIAAQPGYVVTPLLAIGALAGLLSLLGSRSARRRYADLEFRKMRAVDLDAGPVSPRS